MGDLGFDLLGHRRSDTVGPGGTVHRLEGLLHDGAVRDEDEDVLLLPHGVQAMEQRLLQKVGLLVQQGQKRGLGTEGHVNMAGCFAEQMSLACKSVGA